jgi:hypothetical protein
MPPHYWLLAGSAYNTFEYRETKSLLKRRELSAKIFGARQWWSFSKSSAVFQVVGWAF